jgi:soluble lytic murein transglycosylase-like protein
MQAQQQVFRQFFRAGRSFAALIQEDIMLTSDAGPAPETAGSGKRILAMAAMRSRLSSLRNWRNVAHRAITIVGVGAIGACAMVFIKPELADHIKAVSPFSATASATAIRPSTASMPPANVQAPAPAPAPQQASAPQPAIQQAAVIPTGSSAGPASAAVTPADLHVPPADLHVPPADGLAAAQQAKKDAAAAPVPREQAWVTNWLAKRYRVAGDAANMLVSTTYNTAREIKFDPLLILAVIGIESGFNPFAESPVGAQGLMQVMSKVHHDKFRPLGGVKAALNPAANIKVGATILRDYVRESGSVEGGLKRYVGAAAFENDAGYGWKVLAEYRRLKEVANGKQVPVTTVVAKSPTKPAPQEVAEDKDQVASEVSPTAKRSTKGKDDDGIVAAL